MPPPTKLTPTVSFLTRHPEAIALRDGGGKGGAFSRSLLRSGCRGVRWLDAASGTPEGASDDARERGRREGGCDSGAVGGCARR